MKKHGSEGSAAVEMSILLMVLIFMVLGIIDYGWYFFRTYSTQQVAYEAARAGAVAVDNKAAAATAQAADLLTEWDLEECAVPAPVIDDYTTVVVTCPYGSLSGGLVPIPESSSARASYRNF